LACLGNEADFATLSLLRAEPEEALETFFWDALHAGYVVRLANGYRFLHDRVQEAAYSLIPPEDRPSTHLRIGRLLAEGASPEQIEEKIFEIVNQLDLGIDLIREAEERERAARFNLIAGTRAQTSTACASALRYFAAGRALLVEDDCQAEGSGAPPRDLPTQPSGGHDETSNRRTTRYALIFALELHTAQCEYLTGALDAAKERLSLLSVRAANLVDFAAVTPTRLEKPRVYVGFGAHVAPWTKHLRAGIDLVRRAFDAANEAGDLNFAAYSRWDLLVLLFDRGEPLTNLRGEAVQALRFVTKAKCGLMVLTISAQLQLIRALMGQTASAGSFNDANFDEQRYQEQLESDPRLAFAACFYWICKLQACFHAGDYVAALEASEKVKPLSWTHVSFFDLADYHFYGALARTGHYRVTQESERARSDDQLGDHRAQLEIWAQNCPETFLNRALLVSAEIASIESRDLDAMSLYEQAIRSARENGFVQNEGIASELAAAFYAARGFKKIALTYLRNARRCYLRWGAEGKVRQLHALHPDLQEAVAASQPSTTIGTPVASLDLAIVIKVFQAISGKIVLESLIDTLMRTAIEHAGAEHGVLILLRDAEPLIEAEARTDRDEVTVHFPRSFVSSSDLPNSLLRYVIRTKESVTLSDASAENLFSEDEYFRRKSPRSVLCLPLVKQRQLTGILYFENNLAPGVFTPNRMATLELIASQAAISLEQAGLYAELRRANEELQAEISERKLAEEALEKRSGELRKSEQRLQDIVDNTTAVVCVKDLELHYLLINSEYERRYHVQRDQIVGKTDFDVFPHDIAESIRAEDRKVIEAGVPIQFEDAVPSDGTLHYYVAIKFPLYDGAGKPYAICGIATDITALKRAKELETKMARGREMFAQQRALQLAKANEVLREFLDALASVPELDRFLDRVMAAITGQLGAVSSTLRLHHVETNTWNIDSAFENGRMMTPEEAQYPESLRSQNESQISPFLQAVTVYRLGEPEAAILGDRLPCLSSLGVKTLLGIPLISRDKATGLIGLSFAEDREFRPEELEIARALATQISLAIQLAKLAESAQQSAVLQERNRLAAEIHDSLAQSFAGISMQLGMAQEILGDKDDSGLNYVQRADDLARFGLAEARRSTLSLHPAMVPDSGLTAALQMLVDRSSIPGRLRCTFRSNFAHDESLPPTVGQDLLRIAQEAISNSARHARSTAISVTLRSDPSTLSLEVTDNGSGMATETESSPGFGLANMRARVKKLKGLLNIRSAPGRGTSIIVSLPFTSPDVTESSQTVSNVSLVAE
jgi:PAS domain S-box-containing protein